MRLPGWLGVLLVLLSACGAAAAPAPGSAPTAASILVGATPQAADPALPAAPADRPAAAMPPEPPLAPVGDLRRDMIKGLDSLASYRLTDTLTAEPRNGGERSLLETYREVAQGGKERRERLRQTGAPFNPDAGQQGKGSFESITTGGLAYLWTADADGGNIACASFDASGLPPSPVSDPARAILANIGAATLAQRGEIVGGLTADHYKITTSKGLFGSNNVVEGDLWVATETNVVVKFSAVERGLIGLASIPQGTLTASYTLEQVNTLARVTLPPECVGKQPQP